MPPRQARDAAIREENVTNCVTLLTYIVIVHARMIAFFGDELLFYSEGNLRSFHGNLFIVAIRGVEMA